MAKRKILIIGAGKWQIPIYEKAKELGLEIIATDAESTSPGFQFAQHSYAIDVRNFDRTLEIATRHRIDGVLTGVDLAVPCCAKVAQALNLPGLNPVAAVRASHKGEMRRHAIAVGLDVPFFLETQDIAEGRRTLKKTGLPCVVKPVDSRGSRGVTVVEREEQFDEAFLRASAASFTGAVLIEEFMTGKESSVEVFIASDGTPHILGIGDIKKSELPFRYGLEQYYPGDFSKTQFKALENYVRAIVERFEISLGFVHAELMVSGERVRMIEFAARGAGAFISTRLMPAITETDLLSAYIRQALGEPVALADIKSGHGLLKFIVLNQRGVLRAIEGAEKVSRSPGVISFTLDVKAGDLIDPAIDTTGRQGCLLVIGKNREELTSLANSALKNLNLKIERRK